jgi:hypothetical protein
MIYEVSYFMKISDKQAFFKDIQDKVRQILEKE